MSHLPEMPLTIANHFTSDSNPVLGWIFLGVVVTAVWLFTSSVDERTAVGTAAAGWVVGILLLFVF